MEQSEFGLNLSYYRKKCGLTQEHLAQLLMVTPQAVSKWEKGSYPDGDLLPKIAAILDVSLDVLFGLKQDEAKTDLAKDVMEEIHNLPEEERGERFMELGYHMLYGYHDNLRAEHVQFPEQLTKETYAHLRTDQALAIARLNPDMQYLCYFRIPEKGIDSYTKITPRLLKFFQLLSDESALRVLFFAERLPRNFVLTKECISERLHIPLEKVSDIVDCCDKLGIMWELTADTGSTPFPVYGYVHTVPLAAILTLATTLTNYVVNCEPDIDTWLQGPFRNPPEQADTSDNP
ncbi:MAG: helix-turn-helix domain-containing protein [Ruminococcus sp.]